MNVNVLRALFQSILIDVFVISVRMPVPSFSCLVDFYHFSFVRCSNLEKHTETKTRLARQFEDEEMPGYGSLCTTTRDCRNPTVDLQCIRGSCACLEGSVPLGKYLCYSFEGNSKCVMNRYLIRNNTPWSKLCFLDDDDDDDDDDNGADKTTTEIPTVSTSNPKGSKIIKDLGHLGHHCTTDYYCRQAVAQSHCHNGKCACIDGFFSSDSVTCVESNSRTIQSIIITEILDFQRQIMKVLLLCQMIILVYLVALV